MEFHDRLVAQATAMGARNVRVIHRGRRPRLIGTVDGIAIILGLPTRPKDIPQNFFNSVRDLRRLVRSIRSNTSPAA